MNRIYLLLSLLTVGLTGCLAQQSATKVDAPPAKVGDDSSYCFVGMD